MSTGGRPIPRTGLRCALAVYPVIGGVPTLQLFAGRVIYSEWMIRL